MCCLDAQKRESYHDVIFVVTGCTAGCHNDNLLCCQWWQSWHCENSFVSVCLCMYRFNTSHRIYTQFHDDVIKWKYFPCHWPFVRGIHRSPVNSPHKGQWRGALMFSLICTWINCRVNNHEAGDLRRHQAHYDVIIMWHCFVLLWLHYQFLVNSCESNAHILQGYITATGAIIQLPQSQWCNPEGYG